MTTGKKILFVCGSLNQTTMMHQIAQALPECQAFFTPYYSDGLLGWLSKTGALDFTILAGQARAATLAYLAEHRLRRDDGGRQQQQYDLAVTCSDLIIPRNLRRLPIILVQEGMTEPENLIFHMVRVLRLPRYLANTAMTGLSHAYQKFCVASEGYRELFIRKGVAPDKIAVTGLPNFDNAEQFRHNDFPLRGYVLALTSARRETFKYENRPAFIRRALALAQGRQLLFKLHPNENHARARREITRLAPQALIFTAGNTNHMIANCEVMVTRYSSAVYIALALGKEVHADLDRAVLEQLAPLQNGGTSAQRIAAICRSYLNNPQEHCFAPGHA
ncbi:MAG: hypothetical protein ONB48_15445 [candidate division KSB1 bacterium]|nr:hypothetical protein [candidate division KSB1 bacterium]MDZ7276180.1 hypothetical protein [candidate division KSB1 bacterium]MDZ7287040.1 hypothetical protein [candidate division KSB1 bacterium]MDZ7297035.1 hypothetical protein [candidate division KSB1 bacterium]MDZ7309370.1 hypothetical protein [candidate division KSB1 bacterium]